MFTTVIKPFIWIDYSIVVLISVTLSIGTVRGFSREVISLLCWVIGVWTSLHFSIAVSSMLQTVIFPFNKRFAMTFIGLLVSTVLVGSVLKQLLSIRFKQTYQHTVVMERLGGLICGLIQGIVLTTIIVLLTGLTNLPKLAWWHDSSLLPFFQILAIWLRDHVAMQMANVLTYP